MFHLNLLLQTGTARIRIMPFCFQLLLQPTVRCDAPLQVLLQELHPLPHELHLVALRAGERS